MIDRMSETTTTLPEDGSVLDVRVTIKRTNGRYKLSVLDSRYEPLLVLYSDTPKGCLEWLAEFVGDLGEGVSDGE